MKISKMIAVSLTVLLVAGCSKSPVSGSAPAKEISFDGNTPFLHEASVKKEVREQCNLNDNLSKAILDRSKAHGINLSKGSQSDRKLSVEIIEATPGIFVFGNFGSVPAVLTVNFKVTEGKEVVLQRMKTCSTKLAGFMGLQPSACNKLNKCAENQAEFLARTLKRMP